MVSVRKATNVRDTEREERKSADFLVDSESSATALQFAADSCAGYSQAVRKVLLTVRRLFSLS